MLSQRRALAARREPRDGGRRKLRALPIGMAGTHVRVAVVDPTDWQSVDDLPRLLPELSERLGSAAHASLAARGVTLLEAGDAPARISTR